MTAFVLAGGLGTRLRPRFGELPKALAPVAGKPFLVHILSWLARSGIRRVVLCAGFGAEQVRETLGDGSAAGVALTYSVEREPLGTGGALKLAEPHVDGPSLVLNGDTLAACDVWRLERARWENAAIGAVALYRVDDARSRGRVEQDAAGRITGFREKDEAFRGSARVNGGVYAFSPVMWRMLPDGVSSLERDLLPRLATSGRLQGMDADGEFYDIGTPEEWERAEKHLAE